jgi:membrane protease YdiL (CAAX protease family)
MKGRSILEASVVFSAFTLTTMMLPGVRALTRWETRILGGSFFTGGLMVIIPLIAIIATGLDFDEVGVKVSGWRASVNAGFKGYLGFLLPQFAMTFFSGWGIDYREYGVLARILGVVVLVMAYFLLRNLGKGTRDISRVRIALMGIIMAAPFVLAFTYGTLSFKLFTSFIWQVLVGGFAEEFMFRGYIQSTVNRKYGRHWTLSGVKFGPGILVSSALFGLSRAMTALKPWSGVYTLNIGLGLYAFALGLFYGVIREATGDIIGSGTANALIDGVGATFIKAVT